ncbi:MAG: phosphopentomutase [Schwartzia sp.]|nr:phosphopentomutase [Schwartzia sp. (in: firmicutes)]
MAAIQRVYIIVLDSFGVGELPDAAAFGDAGCNTLRSIRRSPAYDTPVMASLGLFHIEGVGGGTGTPKGAFGRCRELSHGKDTTTGHWEIAGIISEHGMPTFPGGFPSELMKKLEEIFGRPVLCGKPYSGTEVIRDYGREHEKTGALIVYTSADSVLQIAAHERIVSREQLYDFCKKARAMMQGAWGVGRVIARPFIGAYPDYERTAGRHDYSLDPPGTTLLDVLSAAGLVTIGIGKISDIFAARGVGRHIAMDGNDDGMDKTLATQAEDFSGLCFVNLVDFDMQYGHRRDVEGYAKAATAFDRQLARFMAAMRPDDVLMITADHGCDPAFSGSDHTREYTPLLVCGASVRPGVNLGTRKTFADIGATAAEMLGCKLPCAGTSFWADIKNEVRISYLKNFHAA